MQLLSIKAEIHKLASIGYLLSCLFLMASSLKGQSKSLKIDSLSMTDIYCIGNVHFDGVYYKKNSAYRKEILENEKKEAAICQYLISTARIGTIALEFPVHNELFLNYFFSVDQESAVQFLDTINFPAYSYKLLRLRRLAHMFPELRFVCVDNAEEEDRFDLMNTLLYSIFSKYKPLEEEYLFTDYTKQEVYMSAWNEYRAIIDSLSIQGYDSEYLDLLDKVVEVRFVNSCRKRKVRQLVEELRSFYINVAPKYSTPFLLRLCNSYISKRTKHRKIKREHFILNEVTQAVAASDSAPVLLQIGKWHIEANTDNNLRDFLENTTLKCTYLTLYQPLYSNMYTKTENELAKKTEKGREVVKVGRNDYLLF